MRFKRRIPPVQRRLCGFKEGTMKRGNTLESEFTVKIDTFGGKSKNKTTLWLARSDGTLLFFNCGFAQFTWTGHLDNYLSPPTRIGFSHLSDDLTVSFMD